MPETEVLRYTAFSAKPDGGNPAGVVLSAGELDGAAMQRIAADVDFAETAFVTGVADGGELTVRYFSPIAEVPFCGHATIATAVALAERGRAGDDGTITFRTSVGPITITTSRDDAGTRAAFTSIPPSVTPLPDGDLAAILTLLGLAAGDLDPELPPRIANAGNPHPVIVLSARATFDAFGFDPDAVRALMDDRGWPGTITVAHRAEAARFIARNLFPVGRITEDPATGSAAAAFGAYLRDLGAIPVPSRVTIAQGAHVGRPGVLTVDIPVVGGIVVSGHAVAIDSPTPAAPTVLFVCVHNAGRSQMAAGFLQALAGDRIEVLSAGSEPKDQVNPVAVDVMREEGIDIAGMVPRLLTVGDVQTSDVVITMGCGDACPIFPGKRYEDWQLDDPAGKDAEAVRGIRDAIKARVRTLIDDLV